MSEKHSSDDESEVVSSATTSSADDSSEGGEGLSSLAQASGVNGVTQQLTALSTRLKLSREQRRRRLLSQRNLGQRQLIESPAFATRLDALNDDDAVLLSCFSNHALFERLCERVQQQGRDPTRSAAPAEDLLADANPLFHLRYAMPLRTLDSSDASSAHPSSWYAAAPDPFWWREVLHTPETQRQAPARHNNVADLKGATGTGRKRGRGDKPVASTSAGLVAQSARAWENHLATELSKEGETVESFRQASNKVSYIDKALFRQQVEQNEYQRELALQARARDLAEKRAIRRGETAD